MQSKIISFLIQCIIYFNHYDFTFGKPMFGPNVVDANPSQFPFIVSISIAGNPNNGAGVNHVCTGSLVTRQDVLTAAHCIEDEDAENFIVILGSINLNNGTHYDISWWITYNEWAEYFEKDLSFRVNDIANLRLLNAVPNNIDLGVLSHVSTEDLYGANVVIAAWGRNEQHVVPVIIRTANLKVLSLRRCKSVVSSLAKKKIKVHVRHICTKGDPYAVIYWGDSGGPVLHMGMIVAINKSTMPFADDPTNRRKINVHTTINYYREFIVNVIDPDFYWDDASTDEEE